MGRCGLKPSSRLWRWAFGLCLLAALVLALMPVPPAVLSTGWDKTNHLLVFGVLMVLGCLAAGSSQRHGLPRCARNDASVVALGLLAFGALIEVLQSFTSYRFAEWGDLLADAVGLALGWVVVWLRFRPATGDSQ